MRSYQIWCEGKQAGESRSLALALSIAHYHASRSAERAADVYQGSEFTATVEVPSPEELAAVALLESAA